MAIFNFFAKNLLTKTKIFTTSFSELKFARCERKFKIKNPQSKTLMKTQNQNIKFCEVENSGVPAGFENSAKKFAKAWAKFQAWQVQIELTTVRDDETSLLIIAHFDGKPDIVRILKQMLETSARKIFKRSIADKWEADEKSICVIL